MAGVEPGSNTPHRLGAKDLQPSNHQCLQRLYYYKDQQIHIAHIFLYTCHAIEHKLTTIKDFNLRINLHVLIQNKKNTYS